MAWRGPYGGGELDALDVPPAAELGAARMRLPWCSTIFMRTASPMPPGPVMGENGALRRAGRALDGRSSEYAPELKIYSSIGLLLHEMES